MIRRFRAAIAATLLTLGLLIPALLAPTVATASIACPTFATQRGSGTNVVVLYEGTGFTNSQPNHNALCMAVDINHHAGLILPNLKNIGFNDATPCDGQLFTSFGSWNDCITAIKLSAPCNYVFTAGLDLNLASPAVSWQGTGSNSDLPFGTDEAISSVGLQWVSQC